MVYHLLPELDVFDELRGGALSKMVANLMKFDCSTVVAFGASRNPWGFSDDRIMVVPIWQPRKSMRFNQVLPLALKVMLYRQTFRPLVERLRPKDVVWCHHHPFVAAAIEKLVHDRGAKLIYQHHDGRSSYPTRVALASFKPDIWVFGSEALRAKYLEHYPHWRNTTILPYGADIKLFSPRSNGSGQGSVPVVIYAGRVQPEKGVHVLLAAVKRLNQRRIPIMCRIVGSHFAGGTKDTPYIRSLRQENTENVEFLGYRLAADLAEDYRSADIFCCPSIWFEAFGMVNVEAMACGLPVVASRVGGIPEIAAEGGVLLVDPGSVDQLADALERLVSDKAVRESMGRDARASAVRRFSWQVAARQYLKVVESC